MKKLFIIVSFCFCTHLFSADTTFLLIRHGQTDWNIIGRAQGHTDNPLNANGLNQAKNVAEKISVAHSDITAIYSSDLDRAYVTAQATANKLGLQIVKTAGLREINLGEAEGLKTEEIKARYPNRNIPLAETDNQVLERAQNELMEIAKRHPDEKVAVFAHGRLIKLLLDDILDSEKTPPIRNCAVVQVVYSSNAQLQPYRFISIE